ncbi:protocadherin gamma-B5-like [Poeciliopsis prolifica]|uniref:protocadherin gamma-B5-like n=1 Tax=Poeciliopsis prolifica TaxID=188132 RepID=UPI002413CA8A|nr:protocadherin gamma-B5-like [Poeciliopsis prolifica]
MARDNGSPPLSSNILYPAPEGSSFMTELVPKAAHGGSLVSKVIAVDADSGQNAWLSYHIVKATDPGLFSIDLHSGEIRTQRDILKSDSMKQNLIVAVKDNGQPSLSATCSMYLLISDNLAEVPELKDISYEEKNSKLTSYLIIALVSVSTFFLTFIIIILGVRFCRRRKPRLLFDGAVAIPGAYLPPNYADVDGTGTLRSTYNYDAYLTTGSRTSDFKFVSSYNDNTLPADQTPEKIPTEFADPFEGLTTPEEARVDIEGARKHFFDIRMNSGDLVTSDRIDRESLCEKKPSCIMKIDLVLENPLELHRITLRVEDVNDNSPKFRENLIEMEIRESAEKGNRFSIEEAHDADIGQNDVQRYILQNNDNFAVAVDSNKVELVLEKKLDREKQRDVSLLLTAIDGGSPQKSGTVVIHVTVLDANDNAPVFTQAVYKASVPENAPPETLVITVSATDADEGVNGDILYPAPEGSSFMTELVPKAAHGGSLVSKVIAVDADSGQNAWLSYHIVKATDPGLFRIDPYSGEIRTQRDISESDSMKQNLIVAVKDNGQPSLSATCSMYLLISDNLAEVPELKDISYEEKNSKLTSYLIIALVSVTTFFLTFIIIILGVRFCRRRKPRLLFDGAVAIPGALPPNYADVDGTGTYAAPTIMMPT